VCVDEEGKHLVARARQPEFRVQGEFFHGLGEVTAWS
jgi:hypothetical protein